MATKQKISFKVDWSQLDLNIEKLDEDWAQGGAVARTKEVVRAQSLLTLQAICGQFSIPFNGEMTKREAADAVLDSFDPRGLQKAFAFYSRKSTAISEYVRTSDAPLCVKLRSGRIDSLAALLCLAADSEDHLHNLETLAKWISYPVGTKATSTKALTASSIQTLEADLGGLQTRLNLRAKEVGFAARVESMPSPGSMTILTVERQTGDRYLREVGTRRRSRPATLAMVRLQAGNPIVEIRNARLFDEPIREWISTKIGALSVVEQAQFTDFAEETFRERMFAPLAVLDEQRLPLVRLACRASLTVGEAQVEVRANNHRSDIRPDLRELDEGSVIRLREPADIESMDVLFDGQVVHVDVELDRENFACVATSQERNLTDEQRSRLAEAFLASVGFPLEKSMERGAQAINRRIAYDELLRGHLLSDLLTPSGPFRKELRDLGVIQESSCFRWKCAAGHSGVHDGDSPPDTCDQHECGAGISEKHEDTRIRTVLPRVKKLVIESIKGIPGVAIVKPDATRKINREDVELVQLEFEKQPAFVFFATGSVTQNFLRFFEHSQVPLVVVRVGREGITSRMIEDSLFSEVSTGLILEARVQEQNKPVPPTGLVKAFQRQAEASQEFKLRAARRSYARLPEKLVDSAGYGSGDFETDAFNVLTWWMDMAEKWGREASGAAIPEGVGAWRCGSEKPQPGYVMAWDCKWTGEEPGYDLTAGEKLKARNYIAKIRTKWEVDNFAGDLSFFALISNRFREGQLASVAAACHSKPNEKWTGQVAFIDADALLRLYAAWASKPNELLARMDLLRCELSEMLASPGEPYSRVTSATMSDLLKRVLEATPAAVQFDPRSLRLRLSRSV